MKGEVVRFVLGVLAIAVCSAWAVYHLVWNVWMP